MFKIDFLDYKLIFRYIIIIGLALATGAVLKDLIALLFLTAILLLAFQKKTFKTIETLLIWFFIANFFTGQQYISSELISKYIAKPSFLLFLIFVLFFSLIPRKSISSNYVKYWILFSILTFLSAITQGQSPFVIISASSFLIIFLLLQVEGISTSQYMKLLNLFIAVAIIQTIVSYLQVAQIIAPPSRIMEDGYGGKFEWTAGLDDVACGTFGAGASFTTSWYAALMSLFMLIMWGLTKNKNYLIVMFLAFLQFATVDSKIIMGVTGLMLTYLLFYLFKKRYIFKISFERYIFFILVLLIGVLGFMKIWNQYYEYYGKETGGSRTSINAVYTNEVAGSIDIVFTNLWNWGKIKGFQNVFNDFIDNNPIQLIWGYGVQGYDINGKMGYIESLDVPIMQADNLTNSRSGLITLFATSGLVGFLVFFMSLIAWFKHLSRNLANQYGLIMSSTLKIFLPFSFFAAFLYPIQITSIPLITFAAIISIYYRLSNFVSNSNNASL